MIRQYRRLPDSVDHILTLDDESLFVFNVDQRNYSSKQTDPLA